MEDAERDLNLVRGEVFSVWDSVSERAVGLDELGVDRGSPGSLLMYGSKTASTEGKTLSCSFWS
jgi:hypothetical protein